MQPTLFQRVVVVLTAVAVILQLLNPTPSDLPATMLSVFAILIAGGTMFWLNPGRKVLVSAAVVVGLGGAALGSLVLWHMLTPQTPSPPARWEVVTAVPTLSELADSFIVGQASRILDIHVDIEHQTFQQLHAADKDTLCKAGKAIRDSMRAHHNTPADLNHTERAIFDITAPAGRCH